MKNKFFLVKIQVIVEMAFLDLSKEVCTLCKIILHL